MRLDAGVERPAERATRIRWLAAAACGWAVIFAGLSFFWAAGGKTGLQPLEEAGAANQALWALANVGAGIVKLAMGVGALVVVSAWLPHALLRPLRILIWVAGVGMLLYGGLGLVSDILHVTGIINDPATRKWFLIYLVLWDPWWMLGGALFTTLAWRTRSQPLSATEARPASRDR